ncbi:MAG: FGGY family carbohydrate kinase [Runella zeae]
MSFILAIDQGTSSTKTLVFDAQGQVVSRASEPLKTHYFGEGFAEQDPEGIFQNVISSVKKCLADFQAQGHSLTSIAAVGISNQRETFILWDEQGKPLHNAVIWQCKRSVKICDQLRERGLGAIINEKTGLLIDPYFSGSKLMWLQQNQPEIREAIQAGKAYFGTVDTWLLYKLTKGEKYLTDYTNASRTLFFNLSTLDWDADLLREFGLTGLQLPQPQPSSYTFGESDFEGLFPKPVPIMGMIGDSHAAAFGEGCFSEGTAKATLGTGCSILMNVGNHRKSSANGMVSTICWSTAERVDYALEGVIVTCGATIEWLKNEWGIFEDSKDTEAMARSVEHNNGVYLVPAFSGLGAPHWDMKRKASITGLTFGSTKNHLVRAALESIPYQIKDIIGAMEADAGLELKELMVDGGMTSNGFVLQFLADLLGKPVLKINMPDVSALGAAYLAGLACGLFTNITHLQSLKKEVETIMPCVDNRAVMSYYEGWQETVHYYEK